MKLSELIRRLKNLQYGINQEDDFNVETATYKNDPEVKVFLGLDGEIPSVVDDLFCHPKDNEVILCVDIED